MSTSPADPILSAQSLMGRKVVDTSGASLGRVFELETKRVGADLCVTALLVGAGTWRTRFGWSTEERGRRVPWEQIISLTPDITVGAGGRS